MKADMTVDAFAKEWLASRQLRIPSDAVRHVGELSGLTLYRNGPFQVQMFIGKPGASAPRHSHPNVDSIEIFLAGDIGFGAGTEARRGRVHISPGQDHIASAGFRGGAFLSIQKWLNGVEPSSVELDWAGAPIDEQHAREIA